MKTLRPYQEEARDDLRAAYRSSHRAPLLEMGTGSGKTYVFSHIAHGAEKKGNNVLILVHRSELLEQSSDSLDEVGVPHGLISPHYTACHDHHVQIASVQTLAKRIGTPREPKKPQLIIIDEAHHSVAGSWRKIIEYYPEAYLLGVTATPCRLDGKGLGKECGGHFDTMVHGPSIGSLTAGGYLAPAKVFAPPSQFTLDGVHKRGGDWAKGELASVMDRPTITGDAVAHYKKLLDGAPSIAFCTTVKHAEHVARDFRLAGYRAESLDGKMTASERKRKIRDLGTGDIQILTSCEIISEGTDIPVVSGAILLRPTASVGLYLQQVGRVLRPAAGKDHAIILDHVGNTMKHGLPAEYREWTLDGAPPRITRKDDDAEGTAVTVHQCEKCYAAFDSKLRICPECGDEREIEIRSVPSKIGGQLSEVTPEQAMKLEQQRVRRVTQGKAQSFEELKAIERARGYKPGWARHVFNSRRRKAA